MHCYAKNVCNFHRSSIRAILLLERQRVVESTISIISVCACAMQSWKHWRHNPHLISTKVLSHMLCWRRLVRGRIWLILICVGVLLIVIGKRCTLFFLYKKLFIRNLYPTQKKRFLKIRNFLGFIQIFKKHFREISCIFYLFQGNLAHFSLGFLIITKNKKLLRNFLERNLFFISRASL